MIWISPLFRDFPGLSRALGIALSVTFALWVGLRIWLYDSRPAIFILGDSSIGNYRLDPGQRLQDFLQKTNPEKRIENLAEPGAAPLDFYLQLKRGQLLMGRPEMAIIGLEPDKFLDGVEDHHLDDAGVNLRWIPWSRSGLDLFLNLSKKEKTIALVQQGSVPFYAIADGARSLWIRYVQWPWERDKMRRATGERRKKIEAKAIETGILHATSPFINEADMANMLRARDAEFLLNTLRREGIQTFVFILPFGNPELMKKTFPPLALARQDFIDNNMHTWLESLQVQYLDLNSPEAITHFPDSVWDDLNHLKSPTAISYMSKKIDELLSASTN